jgi:hypothetical protein
MGANMYSRILLAYAIEKIVEATKLQTRLLKLPPRCVMLLA